jgi:hypothetical protein
VFRGASAADRVIRAVQRHGQRAGLRQLVGPADDGGVTRETEDAVLRTVARCDGRRSPPPPGRRPAG